MATIKTILLNNNINFVWIDYFMDDRTKGFRSVENIYNDALGRYSDRVLMAGKANDSLGRGVFPLVFNSLIF